MSKNKIAMKAYFIGHNILKWGIGKQDEVAAVFGGFNLLKFTKNKVYVYTISVRKSTQKELQEKWNVSEFDAMYTFYYPGFNLRSTDLQAFIGLGQVDKLDDWGKKRETNFKLYQYGIRNDYWQVRPHPDSFVSNFAYPVIHPNRDEIVKELQNNNIEVRPMICGSMGTQPFYVKEYGKLELPNVSIIDKYGFYIPNHPKLTSDEIDRIISIVNRGIDGKD